MEKQKIRINKGVEIEVNDNGDSIFIQVDDAGFYERFYKMTDKLDEISKDNSKAESTREQIEKLAGQSREIMKEIDETFGVRTCEKVFGDIIPSPYLVNSFFEQLIPIVTACAKERNMKIAEKYNRNRKGN